MPKAQWDKTFIFLDESGKPEIFSSKGTNLVTAGNATKYLVIASVRCPNQLMLQQQITEFRAQLMADPSVNAVFSTAYTLDAFHANKDYDVVRQKFYAFINTLDIKIDIIVIDKLKVFSALQKNSGRMYGVMAGQLIKDQLHQNQTEVIFSRKDSKLKLQRELTEEVEAQRLAYIQKHPNLDNHTTLNYQHNPHYSHGGLQVADYVAFAVFHVFENNNRIWYDLIQQKIGRIHDICNRQYFTKSNPL